ncbi:hypothetical protein BHE97_02450 [Aeromicrobium sp. PE09-221]|uniref:hypothetical protein n=1 Tax=Aeromicrobium sp. PE09-221 TaxID=1898043 RepID=UPI000B3EB7DE|nr:hypothetical protein [Aeromicrobium sp. PE09-221]OUZ12575.1 hypothetical protein BHE97_02450 [Aeromicrobium sp. PE09-221]
MAAGALAALLTSATAASAAWTDTATVDTGSLGAHQVISQEAPTCENKGGVLGLLGYAELSWNHVDPRYEYSWEARRVNTGTRIGGGLITPASAAGTPVIVDITPTLIDLGGLAGLQIDILVSARLRGSTSWSAPVTTTRVRSVNLLIVGLSIRCGAG